MATLRMLYTVVVSLVGLLLAAPVVILALPVWAVFALTRLFARVLEPPTATWRELVTFDPAIGWRPRPHVNAHFLIERDEVFHVVTDASGWPGRAALADSQMVIFGDSLAFGFGVDDARCYRAHMPLRVKAISAPGYNSVQQLLLMRELAPALAGKLVVWFVYHGNDLYDNLSPVMGPYRTPFVRETEDGKWEIVTRHLSPRPWRYSSHRHRGWQEDLASLYAPTFLAGRAYAAVDFLLGEGRAVCDAVGARLAVFSIPSPYALRGPDGIRLARFCPEPGAFDPDFPDRRLEEICRRHGIPFVAGARHLSRQDYKALDDHWNERGHRTVADALTRLYRDHAHGVAERPDALPRALPEYGAGA